MAELADAQASGACAPRGVEVRLLSSACGSYIVLRMSYRVYFPQYEKGPVPKSIGTGPELARTIISPLLARQSVSPVSRLPQTSEPMRLFDAHSASVLFTDYIRVLTTSSYLSPQHYPCGFHGPVSRRCKCLPSQIERYMSNISSSLIDRINIHIVVPTATFSKLPYIHFFTFFLSCMNIDTCQEARHNNKYGQVIVSRSVPYAYLLSNCLRALPPSKPTSSPSLC